MSGSHSKIDQDGKLGPVSFHPRKFIDNFLYSKDIKWKIGDERSASPKVAAGKSAEKTSGIVGGNVTRSGEKSSVAIEKISQSIRQKFKSGNTSLHQVAAGFRKIDFTPGTVNLDLGGGKFDAGTRFLAGKNVENLVFDPVNQDAEHNRRIFDALKNGGVA